MDPFSLKQLGRTDVKPRLGFGSGGWTSSSPISRRCGARFAAITANFSESKRAGLFRDMARTTYRIPPNEHDGTLG
jgi:hypothetical protein